MRLHDNALTKKGLSLFGCFIVLLLIGLVMGAVATFQPQSAYADDYTYTVRVWAGNEGTVNGKQTYDEIPAKYGEVVTLSNNFKVDVTDSKYYQKGTPHLVTFLITYPQ